MASALAASTASWSSSDHSRVLLLTRGCLFLSVPQRRILAPTLDLGVPTLGPAEPGRPGHRSLGRVRAVTTLAETARSAVPAPAVAAAQLSVRDRVLAYVALTKPRIIEMLL